MKKTKKPVEQNTTKTPVASTDLSRLEQLCRAPVECRVEMGGEQFLFAGRPLLPNEDARLNLLLQRALPPLLPPAEDGGEPRLDLRSAEYLEAREKYEAQARSLGLFLCFPCFEERFRKLFPGQPLPGDIEKITEFVQGCFNAAILQSLWLTIKPERINADRINFY